MRAPAIIALACAACIACAARAAQADPDAAAAAATPPGTPAPREGDLRPAAGKARGPAFTVTWEAPKELAALYEKYLPPPPEPQNPERHGVALRSWMRDVRKRVPEIAAAEGYFSPTLDVRFDGEGRRHATVTVDPGPRTVVRAVDVDFAGDIARQTVERDARRRALAEGWTLEAGKPFVSADWESAKDRLQEAASAEDYAAATIGQSEARVHAEAARADLHVVVDSGPPFTLGRVEIHGLEHYPESVVRRVVDTHRGERYSRDVLSDLQRTLQNGPWFSSVVVDIDRDPARAVLDPVQVTVTERPRREVGLALGYGTDDGARAETSFRDRNLLGRGFDLQSSVRAAQYDQIGYADVYLPPGLISEWRGHGVLFKDSFGVLAEHSTIEKLARSRFAVAAYRHFILETFETQLGLSYQIERAYPEGSEPTIKRALAPIASATWRRVDNLYDPHRGGVLNVQFAAGARSLASGEDFFKAYAQYMYWVPVSPVDQIFLRAEVGRTFTPSREHLPEDFLYRAGGSRSNRGYGYQSLGVREGEAVVGGRYLATGTAEYVHWLKPQWGAATFVDVGDAGDAWDDLHANPSYGVGARYKTPAGPLALDLAYAERIRKFRLSFSVTFAF